MKRTSIIIVTVIILILMVGIIFYEKSKPETYFWTNDILATTTEKLVWPVFKINSSDVSIELLRLTSVNPSVYSIQTVIATSVPNVASSSALTGEGYAAIEIPSNIEVRSGDILQIGCLGETIDPTQGCTAQIDPINYTGTI